MQVDQKKLQVDHRENLNLLFYDFNNDAREVKEEQDYDTGDA